MEDKLYRLAYRTHYERAKADANRVIVDALSTYGDRCAVGLSGGKDSMAMLGMILQHCKPLVIYNDSGLDLPDSLPTVQSACDLHGLDLLIAKPEKDMLQLLKEVGTNGLNDISAKWLDQHIIINPVKAVIERHRIQLEFIGIRAAESKGRKIAIKKLGAHHLSQRFGCGIAWPLRYWDARDTLACIDELNLPLHPAYLRTSAACPRESIRISWALWGQNSTVKSEEIAYVRRYYPEFYNKIQDLLGAHA